ncbi:hypothetical protein EV356DRAFT_349720 [Viridothelium virens]|uniref:DNA polymerase delta subunit 4 n=1 Tax=Viridothelium virens TaxID=1048519 RepID=A0A6A6GXF4_VIRVR|nr:hypothetical protein EV356DRAFT_349720 [Viridothelium virens]
MAPKRRTSSGPVSKSSQSTLSFNNKNRITKPTNTPSSKDLRSSKPKTDPALLDSLVSDDQKASPTAPATDATSHISAQDVETSPTTAEAAILQQAEQEKARVVEAAESTPEEERARKVSDAKIKAYWREKERQSLAPRVHQEGLSLEEKVLRLWDMSGEYGPCIGIARMKRWQRAHALGLEPPVEVLAVLLKEQEKENWKAQRAHVDELMSSRFNET